MSQSISLNSQNRYKIKIYGPTDGSWLGWFGEAKMATGHFSKTVVDEMTATEESSTEVRALQITSFGDMPLIVLSTGHEDPIPSLSDAEYQNWVEELKAQQSELAALSSNSKHIIAEQSRHFIQLSQPDHLIGAIQEIVGAIQK